MGVSGRVDLPRAKEWLYQAAKQGNQLALKVLQELELAQEGSSTFDFNWQSLLGNSCQALHLTVENLSKPDTAPPTSGSMVQFLVCLATLNGLFASRGAFAKCCGEPEHHPFLNESFHPACALW